MLKLTNGSDQMIWKVWSNAKKTHTRTKVITKWQHGKVVIYIFRFFYSIHWDSFIPVQKFDIWHSGQRWKTQENEKKKQDRKWYEKIPRWKMYIEFYIDMSFFLLQETSWSWWYAYFERKEKKKKLKWKTETEYI